MWAMHVMETAALLLKKHSTQPNTTEDIVYLLTKHPTPSSSQIGAQTFSSSYEIKCDERTSSQFICLVELIERKRD